ncbi:aminodeoxychorismate lyase [Geobacillus sp. 46C-IIa]|uniref:aminodeoxychorismate lyase n=1 Tax=Geobacillus sp. 46C-IIa TaxID=1963025 RepID=UPI0009BD5245|nr:aminodeoxychorismate lyase [Geobacillus sp. 46C-IIa]OQP05803.1 aminodeoxychorismate lyase [Geobacillus sp. 46C-IIa]QNU28842.1 aminodeoxychorismate lyase [Geobacillus sp. 46C-IIa]
MRKRTMRSFAFGLLVSTSLIGAAYYTSPPAAPTEADVEAFLEQHGLVAVAKDEYDKLVSNQPKAPAEQPPKQSVQIVYVYRLVIEKGDTPEAFAKELEAARIIDSARSFNDYLQKHGLTRSIRPGAYNVRSDMDYAAISRLIASP